MDLLCNMEFFLMTTERMQSLSIDDDNATNYNFILDILIGYMQNFMLYSLWAVIATMAALAFFLSVGVLLASKILLIAAFAIITLNPYVIAAIVVTVALVAAFITIRDMFKEIDKTYQIEKVNPSHQEFNDSHISKGSDRTSSLNMEKKSKLHPMEIETQTGSTPSWVSRLFTSVYSLLTKRTENAEHNKNFRP